MFIRYESFGQFIRLYPIVAFIVGTHLIFFLFSLLLPDVYYTMIYSWGVGYNALVSQGEYWRLLTPIFLHSGFGHMLFNSFSLYLFGPALERILGRVRFSFLYLFAGIMGNLGTYLFEQADYAHLGASGAVYGLLGLYFYMKFFRKDLIDPQSAQIVTVFLVLGAIYTFLVPNINVLGHLFGFVGGTVAGSFIFDKK